MKNSGRVEGLILLLFVVILSACNDNGKKAVVPLKDTLEIWADTSVSVLLNEQQKAFGNLYSNPVLQIKYLQEGQIMDGLMNNKINCAVIQRNLTPSESQFLQKRHDFMPKQHIIAYDGFTFITSRKSNLNSLKVSDIKESLKKVDSKEWKLIFENNHCQAIPYFQTYFQLSKTEISAGYTKSNLTELLNYLRNDPSAVGIVPFSYISDNEATSTMESLKDLKVLSVDFQDTVNRWHTINPSQESITTRDYPFVMPMVLLNCNMKIKSGTTFVNYILKPRAQRLFLKCGMVPAIFPAREVIVNTK